MFCREARWNSAKFFSLWTKSQWWNEIHLLVKTFKSAEKQIRWKEMLIQKDMQRNAERVTFDVDLKTWLKTHIYLTHLKYEEDDDDEECVEDLMKKEFRQKLEYYENRYLVKCTSIANYILLPKERMKEGIEEGLYTLLPTHDVIDAKEVKQGYQ